jgi:uncharacterized membrane protein
MQRRLALGLLFSSAIALLAFRRRSLDSSGVAGAVASGTTIFAMGGWTWGVLLVLFFVSSSVLSHFRERDKAQVAADKFSKGSQRDLGQVAANGGVATLIALGYGLTSRPEMRESLQAGFTGALAAANADTWATELRQVDALPAQQSGFCEPTQTLGGLRLTLSIFEEGARYVNC